MRYFSPAYCLPGLLLLALWSTAVTAQPTSAVEADRLRRVLREGRPGTSRVGALLGLGDFYLRKTIDPARDLDSALVLARQSRGTEPKTWL
ncbi:MAG: hypothetical protein ICV83_12820 [Cytophagales bacterium]|nr:hypothetical protein [Cytophagales bacterium]